VVQTCLLKGRSLTGKGDLNFDPRFHKGKVVAPWLSWGPYLWARGEMKNAAWPVLQLFTLAYVVAVLCACVVWPTRSPHDRLAGLPRACVASGEEEELATDEHGFSTDKKQKQMMAMENEGRR